MMKILLKILVAPFALALSLLAALLVFLFDICAFLLTIASVCKNRHPSPICTRFEHHLAGGLAPLALSHFWAFLPVRCRNRTLSDMCTEF